MFCVNCGSRLTDGKPFCPNCGARTDAQPSYQQQQQQQQQPYQPVIPRPAPFPGDDPENAPKPREAYLRYSGSAEAAMSAPARPAPFPGDAPISAEPERKS